LLIKQPQQHSAQKIPLERLEALQFNRLLMAVEAIQIPITLIKFINFAEDSLDNW
jgi:hypothetical protein